MAEIEIAPDRLVVHVTGADRFFAFKSQLEVSLQHVSRVEVNPPDAHQIWHGLRIVGTEVPGLITAGRFLQSGEWAFWDVHDPEKSIAIYLHDEQYAKLVVGVDNPQLVAEEITSALGRS